MNIYKQAALHMHKLLMPKCKIFSIILILDAHRE